MSEDLKQLDLQESVVENVDAENIEAVAENEAVATLPPQQKSPIDRVRSLFSGHEPLLHVIKKDNIPVWQAWLIRIIAVGIALIVCGIVSAILSKGTFGEFFTNIFSGVFGSERRIWNMLQSTAILLLIALAITPAFKMRFWNIGAEGQVLIGGLACVFCIQYFGDKMSESGLLIVMAIASMTAGAIWAVIPAIFKAKWNTNETLFTLMMNYIAMQVVACCIFTWVKSGSGVLGVLQQGHFPAVGGYAYLLNIIIVAVVTVLVYIYLKYSKQGYELTIVGESKNTARYAGISVKKVIVRTMAISGLLCGLAGLLIVGGTDHTISTNSVGGRGFTAILVSWLAKFNPLFMVFTAFIVVFLSQGAAQVATLYRMGQSFSAIITGIFFFFIIGCEFFINYKIKFRSFKKEGK